MSNYVKVMCPFCQSLQFWVGQKNTKKLLACGHLIKFKRTRSQKEMSRKYIRTEYGLELASDTTATNLGNKNVVEINPNKT